jgi:hypothetical protein
MPPSRYTDDVNRPSIQELSNRTHWHPLKLKYGREREEEEEEEEEDDDDDEEETTLDQCCTHPILSPSSTVGVRSLSPHHRADRSRTGAVLPVVANSSSVECNVINVGQHRMVAYMHSEGLAAASTG